VTSPGLALDAAEVFWTEFAIRNQLASYELVRLFLATDVLPDQYINVSQTDDVSPRDGRPDPLPLSQQLRGVTGPQDFANSFFRLNGLANRSLGFTNTSAADALVQRIRRGETLAAVARSQGINFATTDLVDRLIRGFSIQSVYQQMSSGPSSFQIGAISDPAALPVDREGVTWRRVFNVIQTGGNWLTAIEQILNAPEFLQRAVEFTKGTLLRDSDAFASAQASTQTRSTPKSFFAILGGFDRVSANYLFDSNGNLRADSPVSDQQVGLNGGLYRQSIDPTNTSAKSIVGDWNGDGIVDVGVFDGRTGEWYRDTNRTIGLTVTSSDFKNLKPNVIPSDSVTRFGVGTDTPVPGDWDGDLIDNLGVVRTQANRLVWYLDTNRNEGWQSNDSIITFGVAGDIPIVGDWNGDRLDDIGVVRAEPTGLTWYLDSNGVRGWQATDTVIRFGTAGDVPIAADWDGNGTDNIGVYRPTAGPDGTWFLDANGRVGWQGAGAGDVEVRTFRVDVANGVTPLAINVSRPLLQQSVGRAQGGRASSIGRAELDRVVDQAIGIWSDLGISASQVELLRRAEVRIVDLPAQTLGAACKTGIAIDTDAAGHGWLVAGTPERRERVAKNGRWAPRGEDSPTRIDLLSVVLHEFGHLLGLDDASDGHHDGIMAPTITHGVRRLPTASDVDEVFSR
jgi:hypothetical protein